MIRAVQDWSIDPLSTVEDHENLLTDHGLFQLKTMTILYVCIGCNLSRDPHS
jgi:hypothetical protein